MAKARKDYVRMDLIGGIWNVTIEADSAERAADVLKALNDKLEEHGLDINLVP